MPTTALLLAVVVGWIESRDGQGSQVGGRSTGGHGAGFGPVDPTRYLLWAGDLDGDGRLDLLVSFVDAEGPVHLYLSSAAKAGQIVGLAGVYSSPPFGGECDGGRSAQAVR